MVESSLPAICDSANAQRFRSRFPLILADVPVRVSSLTSATPVALIIQPSSYHWELTYRLSSITACSRRLQHMPSFAPLFLPVPMPSAILPFQLQRPAVSRPGCFYIYCSSIFVVLYNWANSERSCWMDMMVWCMHDSFRRKVEKNTNSVPVRHGVLLNSPSQLKGFQDVAY
jgi:hypothetical protein